MVRCWQQLVVTSCGFSKAIHNRISITIDFNYNYNYNYNCDTITITNPYFQMISKPLQAAEDNKYRDRAAARRDMKDEYEAGRFFCGNVGMCWV